MRNKAWHVLFLSFLGRRLLASRFFSTEFTAGFRKKKVAKKKENYGGSRPIFTLTSRQSYYKGNIAYAFDSRSVGIF